MRLIVSWAEFGSDCVALMPEGSVEWLEENFLRLAFRSSRCSRVADPSLQQTLGWPILCVLRKGWA